MFSFGAALGIGAFVEEFGERSAACLDRKRSPQVSPGRQPVASPVSSGCDDRRHAPAEGTTVGSVGLKVGLIARGQAEFYVHPNPGTKEWDTCAPDIILREAGGLMTDCWGRALRYNQVDIVRRFGVLASNRVCHTQISRYRGPGT